MFKTSCVTAALLCLQALSSSAIAQDNSTAHPSDFRVVIANPASGSISVLAVPPVTSWTGTIGFGTSTNGVSKSSDLTSWINEWNARIGLAGIKIPWRIVIAYDQFDEDGDNVHSGTYEELWAGPKKFRISYKSDDLNQIDYATAEGLYRSGDQQWPNSAQEQISKKAINPLFAVASLPRPQLHQISEKFGDHLLDCAVIEKGTGGISNPLQYCFSPGSTELRYSKGPGWHQTAYNDIVSFSARSVANSIDVYDGGKPYLRLRVQNLELMPNVVDVDFVPPVDAKKLGGQTVSGVRPVLMKPSLPVWPDSLRQQSFSVSVEVVICKDGHVVSAHAISGPRNAYKAAEESARKWTYQPYLVLGEAAEVATKITLSNN